MTDMAPPVKSTSSSSEYSQQDMGLSGVKALIWGYISPSSRNSTTI